MQLSKDVTSEQLLGLHWLIRLRWIAVVSQVVICLVAWLVLAVQLPLALLFACISFTAGTNALLDWHRRHSRRGEDWMKPLIIAADIVTLTVMLYFSGGAHNPFTLFYLLHITMAVILLPTWAAWVAIGLCTGGFWLLLHSGHDLVSDLGMTCCNDMETHLKGMVVGMALTGSGIAYFVSQLTAGLRAAREVTAQAQIDGERVRRSTEVATLAAGIAHELATPLGTIAVISQDLESMTSGCTAQPGCREDARVIRQEVERCRLIIEKLGMAHRNLQEDSSALDWTTLGDLLAGYLSEPLRKRLVIRLRPSTKRPLLPQSRLFQSLSILIKNAAEASPPETSVVLEAAVSETECVFRVLDHGPGFPPELKTRIGEPMLTTKSKSGGLGLGLYLVKAFVNECGGFLNYERTPQGTTLMEMRLPLVQKQSP